jgi:hypothetical protein
MMHERGKVAFIAGMDVPNFVCYDVQMRVVENVLQALPHGVLLKTIDYSKILLNHMRCDKM